VYGDPSTLFNDKANGWAIKSPRTNENIKIKSICFIKAILEFGYKNNNYSDI
jgi:hypothetical protein